MVTDSALLSELQNDPKGLGYADSNSPDGYKTTREIARLLTSKRDIPNPDPAPNIPQPFTTQELLGSIDPTRANALIKSPAITRILNDIGRQDRQALGLWAQVLLAGGDIVQSEYDAIMALLARTYPDPNWPATVKAPPRIVELGGDGVTGEQIDRVLGR